MSYDGDTLDIGCEDAEAAIATAEIRVSARDPMKFGTPYAYEEILYDGRWRHLCRTDECDDVCTFEYWPVKSIEETRKHWAMKAKDGWGARVGPDRFAIIDAMTDG